MLNMTDLRNLSPEELREKADGMKKELMQFRFQAKTGKLERQSTLREVRRDIARILTTLSEKRLEQGVKKS